MPMPGHHPRGRYVVLRIRCRNLTSSYTYVACKQVYHAHLGPFRRPASTRGTLGFCKVQSRYMHVASSCWLTNRQFEIILFAQTSHSCALECSWEMIYIGSYAVRTKLGAPSAAEHWAPSPISAGQRERAFSTNRASWLMLVHTDAITLSGTLS